MKRRVHLFATAFIGIAIILVSMPADAEFYKYKDQNGVMRFTDNLSEVPVEQRPEVESYAEPEDFLTPERKRQRNKTTSGQQTPSVKRETPPQPDAEAKAETREQRAVRLKEQKATLEAEYNDIIETQKSLAEQRKTLQSPASYQTYNKHQKRLKARAGAYEKRRQQFEEKVKAYHQSLETSPPAE